ncbi:hypothetical protein E3O06_12645 [Cryobacterium glaciale]|uniref:Lipoprotein n=1 Tax=Cryobacterium glaciale TaxID=1259145 RepID=A0A4R8UTN4_9MICO|nr:hypothetical protein [Cryobacterium glaciale]TFB71214.1 hypothetical protein E3O06_12645 [Cryobacterium glaciale]
MRIPPRRRPVHSAVLTAVLISLAVGALSGCSAAPVPAPSDTAAPVAEATAAPTETPPVFASNEEALAAAEAAYANYLAAGDIAGATGSDSWKSYLSLTTGSEQAGVVGAREDLVNRGRSLQGTTTFDSMSIQSSGAAPDSTWEIRTYVCLDVTDSSMVDATGQSVSTPDRQVRWPMVVVFVTPEGNAQQLLISESRVWSGSNFC